MRRLLTGYAVYFNLRHNRSGHLFQNRYKSLVCEEDSYLLELIRYIHLNPLRAGLVKDLVALDHYPWSGHAVILGKRLLEGQTPAEILSLFSQKKAEARQHYRAFVEDGIPQGKRENPGGGRKKTGRIEPTEKDDVLYDDRVLGSGAFVENLRKRQEFAAEFPRTLEISDIISRVCRHFAIDPADLLQKRRTEKLAAARSVICYLAVRQEGYNGVEVGRRVNLGRSGVCVAADRGEKMAKGEPALLKLVNE